MVRAVLVGTKLLVAAGRNRRIAHNDANQRYRLSSRTSWVVYIYIYTHTGLSFIILFFLVSLFLLKAKKALHVMWVEDYRKGVGLEYRLTSPPLGLDVYSHFLQSSADPPSEYRRRSFCLFSTHDAHAPIPDDAIDICPPFHVIGRHPPVIIRIFSFSQFDWYPAFRYILFTHRQISFFFYQINFWKLYTRFTKRQCAWHDSFRKRTNTHNFSFFLL